MPVLRGLIVAILASVAIAGCGHGRRLTDTPAAAESPTAGNTPTAQDEFASLLERGRTATFTARYRMSGSGEDGLTMTGTVRQVQRGADWVRMDLEQSIGAPDGEAATSQFTVVRTPDMIAFCLGEPGILGALFGLTDHVCLDVNDINNSGEPLPDFVSGFRGLVPQADAEVVAFDVERRTIAGRQARCHRLSEKAGEGTALACYSEAGIPLYAKEEGQFSTEPSVALSGEVEAIEVSDSADDADFELPYPLMTSETLEVRNETDVPVFVNGHSGNSDMTNGHIDLDAGASGVLRAGLFGDPTGIYLGTYESPQWHWTCTWADAKANEPLVIKDQSANCRDTSPDRQEARPVTPVAPRASPGPGLAPFGVAITPVPGP